MATKNGHVMTADELSYQFRVWPTNRKALNHRRSNRERMARHEGLQTHAEELLGDTLMAALATSQDIPVRAKQTGNKMLKYLKMI